MTAIRVGVLGSSGSIGKQTLTVIDRHPGMFTVSLLAARSDNKTIQEQIEKYRPDTAVCGAPIGKNAGGTKIYNDLSVLHNPDIYRHCDIVVNGISGLDGLLPTLAVLKSSARLATANKESIVAAGDIINAAAKEYNKNIVPVDSEHSALWQCLEERENIDKLILTASGGAFRDKTKEELQKVKAIEALNHPTWKMGKKVTIDSATLMNKGMEIIEAKKLFQIENIGVVIHRKSIVHALVQFKDGSMKASLSSPDMLLPIQYALTATKRIACIEPLDLATVGSLDFSRPDTERFPCLKIADEVSKNPHLGVVMSSADEVAVSLYLQNKIGFYDIAGIINKALDRFSDTKVNEIGDVLSADCRVKEYLQNQFGGNI